MNSVENGKANDNHDDNSRGEAGPSEEIKPQPRNEGTLILDATCAPADMHFPTDVALLNDSREKLEEMIDYSKYR